MPTNFNTGMICGGMSIISFSNNGKGKPCLIEKLELVRVDAVDIAEKILAIVYIFEHKLFVLNVRHSLPYTWPTRKSVLNCSIDCRS